MSQRVILIVGGGLIASGAALAAIWIGLTSMTPGWRGGDSAPEAKPAPQRDQQLEAERFARSKLDRLMASFDLSDLQVSRADLEDGGPGKDGIPALVNPTRRLAREQQDLQQEDRVLVVVIGDEAVAYPIAILDVHEIINDVVGGVPIGAVY